MILAVLGIVLLWAGWSGLDLAFSDSTEKTFVIRPWEIERDRPFPPDAPIKRTLQIAAELVTDPFVFPVQPFRELFVLGGGTQWFFHSALAAFWAVLVWGILGGAIARIAMIQIATGERISALAGLRFALGKIFSLVGAPLSPLAGIAVFAALCALFGTILQISDKVGPAVVQILGFLPLLAGLVMMLILVGMALGWPLMITTVAAEGEDSFDALSRSYSYVYQRPFRYAAYVLLAWGIGIVGLILVRLLSEVVIHLAAWGMSFGAPDVEVQRIFDMRRALELDRAGPCTGLRLGVQLLLDGGIPDLPLAPPRCGRDGLG